jgi:hypothetical protein
MITTECQNCGNPVFAFASSCERCGTPNRARLGAFAVAGSLVLLVVAVAVAAFVILRWHRISVDDFAWVEKAMQECDAEAANAPETLRFLVIPMVSSPADDEGWRTKSLNDIGNAILLNQSDTLDALKGGSLRISTERYEFAMRDEATSAVYRWSPSVGVKKFLTGDAPQIRRFRVQFKTPRKTNDAEWGATFEHQAGTCYWVNAIIGN